MCETLGWGGGVGGGWGVRGGGQGDKGVGGGGWAVRSRGSVEAKHHLAQGGAGGQGGHPPAFGGFHHPTRRQGRRTLNPKP